VKIEGGKVLAPTVEFLTSRGIPVMAHVGLTPQAVNILGGYGVRGKSDQEARSIVEDAIAMADAGAFAMVIEGVLEPIAIENYAKSGLSHHRHWRLGPVRRAGAGDGRYAGPV
jgi:3-methyl-2-oxobutanoate hydroxymethyltransferase